MPYASVPTGRADLEFRVVRRAWSDPEFRARLISDPRAAVEEELGHAMPGDVEVRVVEETPDMMCFVIPVDISPIGPGAAVAMTGALPRRTPSIG